MDAELDPKDKALLQDIQAFNREYAVSGWHLQDKLVKEKPDVVVMDIVMPGRSGFQACRDLKSDERYKNIPVILCTSKCQESDKFWGHQQGANTYLVKPVKAEVLLDAIKEVLRQR